jgi:hypothetical protein
MIVAAELELRHPRRRGRCSSQGVRSGGETPPEPAAEDGRATKEREAVELAVDASLSAVVLANALTRSSNIPGYRCRLIHSPCFRLPRNCRNTSASFSRGSRLKSW